MLSSEAQRGLKLGRLSAKETRRPTRWHARSYVNADMRLILTDGQWALIAPLIPEAEPSGRPRKAPALSLVNVILFFLRAVMAWRLLPHDLPPQKQNGVKQNG